MFISASNKMLNGTNIAISVAITINGPNGIYSFDFFILVTINIMLSTAPIKNDITAIAIIPCHPKNSPKRSH